MKRNTPGGRHLHRPARGQRHHPDLLPVRLPVRAKRIKSPYPCSFSCIHYQDPLIMNQSSIPTFVSLLGRQPAGGAAPGADPAAEADGGRRVQRLLLHARLLRHRGACRPPARPPARAAFEGDGESIVGGVRFCFALALLIVSLLFLIFFLSNRRCGTRRSGSSTWSTRATPTRFVPFPEQHGQQACSPPILSPVYALSSHSRFFPPPQHTHTRAHTRQVIPDLLEDCQRKCREDPKYLMSNLTKEQEMVRAG